MMKCFFDVHKRLMGVNHQVIRYRSNKNNNRRLTMAEREQRFYEFNLKGFPKQEKNTNPIADIEKRIEESKQRLKWRQNVQDGGSALGVFSELYKSADTKAQRLQDIVKLSDLETIDGIQRTLVKRNRMLQVLDQTFHPERHRILGNDLAAAHFIIHRGGAVRSDLLISRNHSMLNLNFVSLPLLQIHKIT